MENIENIKKRLNDYKYNFFSNLQHYLDTELLFYGSIKRLDYFKNNSDIDIAIITDNSSSMLSKIKNYLNITNTKVQKIYKKFSDNSVLINGYKLTYKDEDNDMGFDIVIYDEKYRNIIIKDVNDINNLPIYVVMLLCILKTLFYKLQIIPKALFLYLKNTLFSFYLNSNSAIL